MPENIRHLLFLIDLLDAAVKMCALVVTDNRDHASYARFQAIHEDLERNTAVCKEELKART